MKKLILLLSICCIGINLYAFNKNTKYPHIEKSFSSECPILEVIITDESTIVSFRYVTNEKSTISLSSSTTITANGMKKPLRIKNWGVRINETEYLDLDKWYTVNANIEYIFFAVFPQIPLGIEKINIRENLSQDNPYDEFFWEGISINNSNAGNRREDVPKIESNPHDNFSENTARAEAEHFEATASGTGFAITQDGLIVTNYHVIENATKFRLRGLNGDFETLYRLEVVAADRNNDLAVLKINDNRFTSIDDIPYTISNKTLSTGDDIFVLGYPLRALMGDEIKLSNGLISSKSGYQGDVTSYQISASIQPGNSGGPLFDKNGVIVGVVNARLMYIENAGYAIKGAYLVNLLSSLETTPNLPQANKLIGKTLSEQVKLITKYIYIIEVE